MAAVGEAFLKPSPWSIYLDLTEGFASVPRDDGQVNPLTRFSRPPPWTATDATGQQYGLADWQGADGFTVSWDGDVGRIAGSGARSPNIYRHGSILAVAPLSVISAAIYETGGERRLVVAGLEFVGNFRFALYTRPLSALPSLDTTLFNATTAPTGWRALGTYTLPADAAFATAYGMMVFNNTGTQGRKILLRGLTKGLRVAHSLRVDIAGNVATWIDEGQRGSGIRTQVVRTRTIVTDNYIPPDFQLNWTFEEQNIVSGSQGFLVDFQGSTPIFVDLVGAGTYIYNYSYAANGAGTENASGNVSSPLATYGLWLRGGAFNIPLATVTDEVNNTWSGGVPNSTTSGNLLHRETWSTVNAIDIRRNVAVWHERESESTHTVNGVSTGPIGSQTAPGILGTKESEISKHMNGAGEVDSAPLHILSQSSLPGTIVIPGGGYHEGIPGYGTGSDSTTSVDVGDDNGPSFTPYVQPFPYVATDRDGNIFLSQPVVPFAAPQQYFNFLTSGDLPTLSGLDGASDRYDDIGQF